jgi:hypothetical protein
MPPYLAWELDVSMGTVPFRFEHQWLLRVRYFGVATTKKVPKITSTHVMIYSQSPDQSPLLLSDKYF